jgi:hypothetical protein
VFLTYIIVGDEWSFTARPPVEKPQWLRHYYTSRKAAGSRSAEVHFFPIYLIIPAALGPGVHSASNRNEYQKQKKVSGV